MKIKPCPFCGKKLTKLIFKSKDSSKIYDAILHKKECWYTLFHEIKLQIFTNKKLIKAWNKRDSK